MSYPLPTLISLAGDQVDHPPVESGTPGGSPSRCERETDDTGREHTHGQHMGITHLQQSHTLSLTLRSLKQDYNVTPNKKAALRLDQVRQLVDYCQLRGLLGFTLKLAIVLAFFGLLRISNLVLCKAATFNPQRDPTRADLTFEAPGLQYAQKWAKNRQSPQAQQDIPRIPIPHFPDDPLDPVQALLELHNLTPAAKPCDPLLLVPTPDGRFYTLDQRTLRTEFKHTLIACDLDPKIYTPHSLRKGGATLLHLAGANRHDIKGQGLWKSEAVSHYIQDNTLTHSSAINAFANSVNQGASTSKAAQTAEEDKQAHRHKHTKKQDKKKCINFSYR